MLSVIIQLAILILSSFLNGFGVEASGFSIDYLPLARCSAVCLSKYGTVVDQTFQSGLVERSRRCTSSCATCSAACDAYLVYGTLGCDAICSDMKDDVACRFGCSRMAHLYRNAITYNVEHGKKFAPIKDLKLVCLNRDHAFGMVARFKIDLNEYIAVNGDLQAQSVIFIYESRHRTGDGSSTDWVLFSMQSDKILTAKLPECTHFQLRVFALNADGMVSQTPISTDWISINNESPMAPTSISVAYQESNENGDLSALVMWEPNPLYLTCFYHLAWQSEETSRYTTLAIEEDFSFLITGLSYDTNYTLRIAATSGKGPYQDESNAIISNFRTLTCLEATDYNLKICPPGSLPFEPNVTVSWNGTASIRWSPPEHLSLNNDLLGYVIRWQTLMHLGRCFDYVEETINVSTVNESFRIEGLSANCFYIVGIAAVSPAGLGPFKWSRFNYTVVDSHDSNKLNFTKERIVTITSNSIIYWSLGGAALVVCCLATLISTLHYRCQQRKRKIRKLRKTMLVRSLAEKAFPRNRVYQSGTCMEAISNHGITDFSGKVKLGIQIGEGAFGRVFKAECESDQCPTVVAVKILKDSGEESTVVNFVQEIDLMKRLSQPHPHIVRFYGICSEMNGFVMEYCPDGNLKEFLQNRATGADRLSNGNLLCNQAILMRYACQISLGVKFLHDQQLVHRDLAARNILVTNGGKTVKISDFGLCRTTSIGEYKVSTPTTVLPVKWMAPESLFAGLFTTMSDVWSFGILLYELMTVGGDPYPDINSAQLPELLKTGYRMEKPQGCIGAVYLLMLKCWSESPTDRPTIENVRFSISGIINALRSYTV